MKVILVLDDHDVVERVRLRDAAPGIWRVRLELEGNLGRLRRGAIIVGPLADVAMYPRYARANVLRAAAAAIVTVPK